MLLVISPHLDDAVLSCGELLSYSDALVVTVFAGVPDGELPVTDYDVRSGWKNARDAMIGRRAEDARAMAVLNCGSVRFDFLDRQYGVEADSGELVDCIDQVMRESPVLDAVLCPLGLLHGDHELVQRCVRAAMSRPGYGREKLPLLFYTDLPARSLADPRMVADAMAAVGAGDPVWQHHDDDSKALKRAAIACYRSQVWALNVHDSLVTEQFYAWTRP